LKFHIHKYISLILVALILSTALAPIAQASDSPVVSESSTASVEQPCPSCAELSIPKPQATSDVLMPVIYGFWLAEVTEEYTDIHLWYKLLPTVSSTTTITTTTYTYATNTPSYINPHAVATTTGDSTVAYTYDNNGNLTSNGTSTYTWDYNNRLTQAVGNNSTSTYTYNPWGQRVKQTVATTSLASTYYPTKFYNTDGTTPVKHIFAGDMLIATVTGTGTTSTVSYIHTDHLGGTSVVTDSSGATKELTDYYPYGNTRFDDQTGFNEQRKFTGHEYDSPTGLSYMNARYYTGTNGRFISQDPLFLAIGDNGQVKQITGQELQRLLADPQALNAYAYARGNPLRLVDPNGEWIWDVVTGRQSWNSFALKVGDAAQTLYNTNSAAQVAMDNPLVPGVVGLVAGGAAGVIAGASALGVAGAQSLAGTCIAFCNKAPTIVRQSINVTSKGMLHIQKFHSLTSDKLYDKTGNLTKSYFSNLSEVSNLIQRANGVTAKLQPWNGNFQRIMDAGKIIGFDKAANKFTSTYTVITDKIGNLVTSHPGLPSTIIK